MNQKEYTRLSIHEVKNIVAAISGFSEFIELGFAEGERLKEMSQKVGRLSRNLADFVDRKQLLDELHEKWYEGNRTCFQFADVVEYILKSGKFSGTEGKNIRTEGDFRFEMTSDEYLIRQLLTELTGNALLYTSGGEILFGAEKSKDKLKIWVKNQYTEGFLCPLETLTEPYFRMDKQKSREMGHYGLGLALAKEIAVYLGGTLSLTYEKNLFTAVTEWSL